MWTDRFCPECGLKLAEIRNADGTVDTSHIACRNFHSWRHYFEGKNEYLVKEG